MYVRSLFPYCFSNGQTGFFNGVWPEDVSVLYVLGEAALKEVQTFV